MNYKQYRRKQIAELADWEPGFDMSGVSVSDADKAAGSPKLGDKIARNPANHADRWLVAADYFGANFEPLSALQQREECSWVEEDEYWQTGCGRKWVFTDSGTPKEHGMEFCYHCGKPLAAPDSREGE